MADDIAGGGETRTCPKCGLTKPTSAFSRSSRTKHGFQSRCKECKKVEARNGYAKNVAHYRAYHREKQRERRDAGKERWVDVECSNCGKVWRKRENSLKVWQGRCGSCAAALVLSDPKRREALAEKARKQVAAWGGRIPNTQRWGYERPIRGKDHPRWKGGITEQSKRERATAESVAWRTSVFQRDHYTCQKCGQVGHKLNAHHVKPWANHPDLRFELSNGVTLCKACHQALHADEAGRRLGEARDRARAERQALAARVTL